MKTEKLFSQNPSWMIISFIALATLFLLYPFLRSTKETVPVNSDIVTDSNSATDASSLNSSALRAEENALYVSEQKPGNSIFVNFAILKNGGYTVIHENKNEKPGIIIGFSQHLLRGKHQNFTVRLTRPIKSGDSLYAMLHEDDGDGVFNPTKDASIRSSVNDEPMLMIFDVDENANPDSPVSL